MSKMLPTKILQGGYSDIRLWPCYMIFSGLMLFLMPQIGFFSSLLIVATPSLLIAKWAADRQPKDIFDYESWGKDFDLALDRGLALPDSAAYWSIGYKKPKIKVEKEVLHKSPRLKVATAKS